MTIKNGQLPNGQTVDDTEVDDNVEVPSAEEHLRLREQNAQMLQALSHPGVRDVLTMLKAGKQPVVSEHVEQEADPEPEPEVETGGEADPHDKLLKTITALVKGEIKNALTPVTEQLAGVQNVADKVQAQEVTSQVSAARSKFKDFDQYKNKILELSKEIPGLQVQDYYILAKSRSGNLRMVEQATATERPSNQPPRGSKTNQQAATPNRSSKRKAFADSLAEVLGGLTLDDNN